MSAHVAARPTRPWLRLPARVAPYLACLLVVIGVWWLVVVIGTASPFILPAPSEVAPEVGRLAVEARTHAALLTTAKEIGAAFGIAAGAALLIGIPLGWFPLLRHAYEPLVANLAAIPLVVLYPVFALALGLGSASKIAFAGLYGFFPIVIGTVAGVAAVDVTLVTAARAMGARGLALVRTVILPAALPQVLSGLQLGLVLCTLAVVGGEYIGGTGGLGYELATAGQAFRTIEMYAYVVITFVLACVLNGALALIAALVRRRLHS